MFHINFRTLDKNDCPNYVYGEVSKEIDELKSIVNIKPKVAHDLATILEKYPCNVDVPLCLDRFVSNYLLIIDLSISFNYIDKTDFPI